LTQHDTQIDYGAAVAVTDGPAEATVLVVCEHASNRVPDGLEGLGVGADVLRSHVAWDPGAAGVARHLAARMQAVLVEGCISRLVYDCNRPPEAASAIPARSEIYHIPGNADLSPDHRAERVAQVYRPFEEAIDAQVQTYRRSLEMMVTVHSFTPVFNGVAREVELGILHGIDPRFAEEMMACAEMAAPFVVRLNEPYAASDGVAHTLDLHGTRNGLANVMIEIRNDLIATDAQQAAMAERLAAWITQVMDGFLHGEGAA